MELNFTANPDGVSTIENDSNDDSSIPVFQIIFVVIMVTIMFGMGCAVEYEHLRKNLKRPIGLAVGLVCQIFLMPILTYGLISLSSMSTIQGLSLMLVGCSPGGTSSNVLTYLIDGDISLSVAMTTFSNLLALGTLPLYVFLYSYIQSIDDDLNIPFKSLGTTLISIVVPIVIGIALRYKFPSKVRYIPKVCAIIGVIMLIATAVTMVVVTEMPFSFSTAIFVPTALLPLTAILVPCAISFLPQLKLSTGARKAIMLEVAIQNGGLAHTILVLSFGARIKLMGQAMVIPLLYYLFQAAYTFIIAIGYQIWIRRSRCMSRHQVDNRLDFTEYKKKEEDETLVGTKS